MDTVLNGAVSAERPRRSRRKWLDDEKRRIVSEALSPGVSVADVSRRHGVNANLLFNWVRAARRLSLGVTNDQIALAPCLAPEPPSPACSADFIQLGIVGHAPDGSPALLGRAEQAECHMPSPVLRATTPVATNARPGLIEIELANGTTIRVDGSVNERALHRVMSALKAAS